MNLAGLTAVVADDPAVFDAEEHVNLKLPVSAGDGFAILGQLVDSRDRPTVHAWLSPDGRSWERVAQPDLDLVNLEHVIELPGGRLLAAGLSRDLTRLWSSDDLARTWTPQPPLPGSTPGTTILRLTSGPTGVLIVVAMRIDGKVTSTLWWSADGGSWTPVAMPAETFADADIHDVAATPSGFVAVGNEGDQAAAWHSVDGRRWEHATIDGGSIVLRAYATARGVLALGLGNDAANIRAWHSPDGRTWRESPKVDTENGRPITRDGRLYILRQRSAAGSSVTELEATEDGLAWQTIASGVIDRRGSSLAVAAGGKPGIIQVGYLLGKAEVWFMPWPS